MACGLSPLQISSGVKWFVSGKQAERIVNYYQDRFARGTRFVAFGEWEWDERRSTFSLMVNKPEEIEILPQHSTAETQRSGDESEPEAEATGPVNAKTDGDPDEDFDNPYFVPVHTARRVPVYRKLGPFQTKRLREVIHCVLQNLDRSSVSDNLPSDLLERQGLATRAEALKEIHFPPENSSKLVLC